MTVTALRDRRTSTAPAAPAAPAISAAPASSEKKPFDSYESMKLQQETRGTLLQTHLKFYTKYLFGAVPILSENISEIPPEHRLKGVARSNEIALRTLLYARGLLRSNSAFHSFAKREMARLLKDVSQNNEPFVPQPLPVWRWEKDGGPEDFYQRYVRRPHPVIIKGLDMAAGKWTIQSLIERFGETPVIFSDKDDHHFEAPLRMLNEHPEHYVHNCGRLFVDYPVLMEEVELGKLEPYMKARGPVAQLFLGNKLGTGTRFHCAGNFNLFFQIEGKKRWWFIDPNHMFLMYPWLSAFNTYQASLLGVPRGTEMEDKFPLFRYCPRFTADLVPGDVLLNPPWWYHSVDNLTERTVAMATRWFPPDMVDTNRLYACFHTEPRFLAHILGRFFEARKRGDRPNAWLIFEDVAHDDSLTASAQPSARDAWGL